MACDAVDNEDLQGGHMISLDFVNSSLSEVEFGSDLQYKIIFYKADNANISASKEVKYNDLCYVAEEAWMSFDEFKKYQFSISNYNLNEYVYQIVVLAKANDRDEYVYDTTDKNEDGICSMDELRILRNYTPDGTVIPLTMSNYIGHQLLTDEIVKKKQLTAIMVTHNLRYAVEYGNRLLMMHQGEIIMDWSGKEKQQTSVEEILKLFNEISIECGN